MNKPEAIEHTTNHGYKVVMDDPKMLVIKQGFPCIDGGKVKHNGEIVHLMVRYDDKPDLREKVEAWLEAWQEYEAEKAKEFTRNVPGLKELQAAKDAAANEEDRYQYEFERSMDSEGGMSPKSLDTSLRTKANELGKRYPRAAVYLRAKSYTYSNNHHKYGAGKKAMELIASGVSLDEAKEVLENWVPEEAAWN